MTGQAGASTSFMPALPPVSAGAAMHAPQAIPRNMSFGGINAADDPNPFYYAGYAMFPPPGSWLPGNVAFPAPPMPHNSPLPGGDWGYYSEQSFGNAPRDGE